MSLKGIQSFYFLLSFCAGSLSSVFSNRSANWAHADALFKGMDCKALDTMRSEHHVLVSLMRPLLCSPPVLQEAGLRLQGICTHAGPELPPNNLSSI